MKLNCIFVEERSLCPWRTGPRLPAPVYTCEGDPLRRGANHQLSPCASYQPGTHWEADGTLKGVMEESLRKKQLGSLGRVREPRREEEKPRRSPGREGQSEGESSQAWGWERDPWTGAVAEVEASAPARTEGSQPPNLSPLPLCSCALVKQD